MGRRIYGDGERGNITLKTCLHLRISFVYLCLKPRFWCFRLRSPAFYLFFVNIFTNQAWVLYAFVSVFYCLFFAIAAFNFFFWLKCKNTFCLELFPDATRVVWEVTFESRRNWKEQILADCILWWLVLKKILTVC